MPKLEINLSALEANYRLLASKSQKDCAAVVKANAYGLGVAEIAKKLHIAGCRTFFTAYFEEALTLRQILPEVEIFVFHGISSASEKGDFLKHNITPILNHPGQLEIWGKDEEAGVQADTGMTRLGFDFTDLEKAKDANISLLMSHLACADQPYHPQNQSQLEQFNQARQFFPEARSSLAASAGIFLSDDYHFDLTRPGIALYGGSAGENPMKPVVRMVSKVLQIRTIDSKRSVGYGATCVRGPGSVIATVATGYADGMLRALSNMGFVYANGYKLPIIGRISMDLVTVDFSGLPEKDIRWDPLESTCRHASLSIL